MSEPLTVDESKAILAALSGERPTPGVSTRT